jgi:glycine cleavage system H protein
MSKWKTVRVRQELMNAVERTLEKTSYRNLSEFVSDAIQIRLSELNRQPIDQNAEYPLIHERLLCSNHHIWAMVTPDGNIRIGLSDYAQRRLKGITSLSTEPVGHNVTRNEPFGFVETWMFKFDLFSPASGRIVKINNTVLEEPSKINEDPYEAGWIAEIKPESVVVLEEELRDLMSPNKYKIWAIKLNHFAQPKAPRL